MKMKKEKQLVGKIISISACDVPQAFEEKYKTTSKVDQILVERAKYEPCESKERFYVTVVTPRSLGFENFDEEECTFWKFSEFAKNKYGLEPLSSQKVSRLSVALIPFISEIRKFPNQMVSVATELVFYKGAPHYYSMKSDGRLWLSEVKGNPYRLLDPDEPIIFGFPK